VVVVIAVFLHQIIPAVRVVPAAAVMAAALAIATVLLARRTPAAAEAVAVITLRQMALEQQAAPALSSSSTPYPYSQS
jgi:hypothetical protein